MRCEAANNLAERMLTSKEEEAVHLREELAGHMESCPHCQTFFRGLAKDLRDEVPEAMDMIAHWETEAEVEEQQAGFVEMPFGGLPLPVRKKPSWRGWVRVLAAAACLAVAALVVYPFVQRHLLPASPPASQVAERVSEQGKLYLRGGEPYLSVRSAGEEEPSPPAGFEYLGFQHRERKATEINEVPLPSDKIPALKSLQDDYRLVFQVSSDTYLYVFQLDPTGRLYLLFPNQEVTALSNPVECGRTYYLPGSNSWFYLDRNRGEEKIFILRASTEREDLEMLWQQYRKAKEGTPQQKQARDSLLNVLQTSEAFVVKFNHLE